MDELNVEELAALRHNETNSSVPVTDRREYPRHPFHWHVVFKIDGPAKETHHGKTFELSLAGCSVVISENITAPQSITLYLQLPVLAKGHRPQIVESKAKVTNVRYSSAHDGFVAGISFLSFQGDGIDLIKSRLPNTN